MATTPQQSLRVVIADEDLRLANVLRRALHDIGIGQVHVVPNGEEAFQRVLAENPHLVISDLAMEKMDGLEFTRHIRRHPLSKDPTIPVIMLSAQAEKKDVAAARDAGVNEFVTRPFSIHTLMSKVHEVADSPRSFVITDTFAGPDRRRKEEGGADPNQRAQVIAPIEQPTDATSALMSNTGATIWQPNYSIRQALGGEVRLQDMISGSMLDRATNTIQTSGAEALNWIQENLAEMDTALMEMNDSTNAPFALRSLQHAALSVKARAGTFGHMRASEVAWLLYQFCEQVFDLDKPQHRLVAAKHVEALHAFFRNTGRSMVAPVSAEIVQELKQLVEKIR